MKIHFIFWTDLVLLHHRFFSEAFLFYLLLDFLFGFLIEETVNRVKKWEINFVHPFTMLSRFDYQMESNLRPSFFYMIFNNIL